MPFDPIYELVRVIIDGTLIIGTPILIFRMFWVAFQLRNLTPSGHGFSAYYTAFENDEKLRQKYIAPSVILAYPVWGMFYSSGQHPTQLPAATTKPIDIDDVATQLRMELKILRPEFPDLTDRLADLGEQMMRLDLTPPENPLLLPFYEKRVARAQENPPLKILREAFISFLNGLPSIIRKSSAGLTTKLSSLLTESGIGFLYYSIVQKDVFELTYGQYTALWKSAEDVLKQRTIERDSQQHINMLLVPAPQLNNSIVPVSLPQPLRFEGTWIVAPQGRGKTTLLSALLKADLEEVKDGKACVIIFDSKGDLLDHVKQLRRFAPGGDLAGKLTLIEPSANLALNPLQLGASQGHNIALLEYVFRALLETKTTSLQSTLFRSVLIALRAIPGATFITFRDFIQDGWEPYEQYIHQLHSEDRDFFLKGEFGGKTYRTTRDELLWRIRDLTTRVPLLRDMFRAPETKIDMARLMDSPGVVVIDNSIAQLAEGGSEFFSRFFIALILNAAQQRAGRSQSDKLPVYVYLDEAQTVIAKDENIATIIQTCRSHNIAMTFAHQSRSQLKIEGVQSSLADCAIRFANPDKDAKALASDFRTNTETLQQIPKGKFALYVRDETTKPIIVSVPNEPVSTWPKMSAQQLHTIREDMTARYSFVPRPQSRQTESAPVQQGEVIPPRQRGGQNVTPLTGEIVEPQRDSTGRVIISEKYGERTVIVEKGTKPQKW